MNRRQFLKTVGVGAAVVSAPLTYALMRMQAEGAFAPSGRSMEAHAIERLTFGVTPELYSHVKQVGTGAFIAEQLSPETIADPLMDYYLGAYQEILSQNAGVLIIQKVAGNLVSNALLGSHLARALHSNQQLHERMVQFFTNHFHVYSGKGGGIYYKVDDERDVIRTYAMTTFRQILGASAHSPAMLYYLDNATSTKDRPNENYAREMMELHTLSLEGGYTETDVKEVARCFTGWAMTSGRDSTDGSIEFLFREFEHDMDAKTVLGMAIPAGGGQQDGETVLDLVAKHPAAAKFISTKIARRFVSDNPPAALIEQMSTSFQQSGGEIVTVLHDLFAAQEFWNASPKFKLPFEYLVSILRALNVEMSSDPRFLNAISGWLRRMGNYPFLWPSPNGYPDVQAAWLGELFERWNIALAITSNSLTGANVNLEAILDLMQAEQVPLKLDAMLSFMGNYLLGRDLTDNEREIVSEFAQARADDLQGQFVAGTTLLLASPAFQYR
ncbi:MAG: DUF1800 family protein [Chloroflexi bacterium]|nr:DUF1800 family protein [Chloroflexota bacterium]